MVKTATEKFVNWITGNPIALFDALGSTFGVAGTNHSIGLVPDPGATPNGFFLRDDGTWVASPAPAAGTVTNAMLADMAQSTIKGRAAGGGTGAPQDLTATQSTEILNIFVGDSGGGGLKGLVTAPASADGTTKFLKANGTWAIPATNITTQTLIASGSLTGATVDITNIPATYSQLILQLTGASLDTASRQVLVQGSTNNGVSFDSTAGNYTGFKINGTTTTATTTASLIESANFAAATTQVYSLNITGYQGNTTQQCLALTNSTTPFLGYSTIYYIGSTSAINALRILLNGTGNFDAGTYALYGII